jgi:hypothetical protein
MKSDDDIFCDLSLQQNINRNQDDEEGKMGISSPYQQNQERFEKSS